MERFSSFRNVSIPCCVRSDNYQSQNQLISDRKKPKSSGDLIWYGKGPSGSLETSARGFSSHFHAIKGLKTRRLLFQHYAYRSSPRGRSPLIIDHNSWCWDAGFLVALRIVDSGHSNFGIDMGCHRLSGMQCVCARADCCVVHDVQVSEREGRKSGASLGTSAHQFGRCIWVEEKVLIHWERFVWLTFPSE